MTPFSLSCLQWLKLTFSHFLQALSYVALWAFGLFCMLYASAPVSITEEMRADFDAKLLEASSVPGYEEALEALIQVQE